MRRLNVTRPTILYYIETGKLKAQRPGKKRMIAIREDELERFATTKENE